MIRKTNLEKRRFWAEAYIPGVIDSDGDMITEEDVAEMAYDFMRKKRQDAISLEHGLSKTGCYVIESFIARGDDSVFIPGSWVLGVQVTSDELWKKVKSNEINGLSIEISRAEIKRARAEVQMGDKVEGITGTTQGHSHAFVVDLSKMPHSLSGFTGPGPDGHTHKITRGMLTDKGANGHAHTFSIMDYTNRVVGLEYMEQGG